MGVKHLQEIEAFLRRKKKGVTETGIRNELSINRASVKECLSYLMERGRIGLVGKQYTWVRDSTGGRNEN